MEKATLGELREKENVTRKKLREMTEDAVWIKPLAAELGHDFSLANGSNSDEKSVEETREDKVFGAHFVSEALIPRVPTEAFYEEKSNQVENVLIIFPKAYSAAKPPEEDKAESIAENESASALEGIIQFLMLSKQNEGGQFPLDLIAGVMEGNPGQQPQDNPEPNINPESNAEYVPQSIEQPIAAGLDPVEIPKVDAVIETKHEDVVQAAPDKQEMPEVPAMPVVPDTPDISDKLEKPLKEEEAAKQPEEKKGTPSEDAKGVASSLENAEQEFPKKKDRLQIDALLRPPNYKTVPCKLFHSATGSCGRGDFCHFIHDPKYHGKELPEEYWKNKKHHLSDFPQFPGPYSMRPFPPQMFPPMPGMGRPPHMPMYNFPPGMFPFPYMPRNPPK
jgi:hypothetical protein